MKAAATILRLPARRFSSSSNAEAGIKDQRKLWHFILYGAIFGR